MFKSFTSHNCSNNNTPRCAVILLAEYGANVDDLEFNVDERDLSWFIEKVKKFSRGLYTIRNARNRYKGIRSSKRDIVMKGEYIIDAGRLALHTAVL